MKGIENASEAIKKKLKIDDYKTESQHVDKVTKTKSDKAKVTFYVSKDILKKLDEIYAKRLLSGRKIDRSSLICEIIKSFNEG